MAISNWFERCKPVLAMVVVQCIYAGMALSAKQAFTEGMNTMVFVVYRQAIATLVLVPISILSRRGRVDHLALGIKGFSLVFVASLVGATLNQYLYYKGMDLSSSSMATAMTNLIPAVTFIMALFFGMEKVKLNSLRSMAKILGTLACVGGAMCMAMYKGPTLLNEQLRQLLTLSSLLQSVKESWMIGCLFLMGSTCCWSFWLILQVPICKNYLDPLSLSAWMCFLSTFQSAILTVLIEPNINAWKIKSLFELGCCLFAGIFGSGVTFYLQSWSIAIRGPLFSALFNPLSTIMTTILGFLWLNETIHLGSLVGGIAVILGLYIVLWGKANEYNKKSEPELKDDSAVIPISIESQQEIIENDLSKPLLVGELDDVENQVEV
ncbi:WAT1-related protein At4g30420-like [Dioscorea cayenensis subsp. rotundata]|uniref:WAT1-related protein n=1 Tax=Dioscorea cayennensis subsp. rotundata TaxID=55577 RepID=A0AB40AXH6_DIOCR|nr:WAT1-related protein At4g30420-like [Dioscorea cayenensis subsp. rotundata]